MLTRCPECKTHFRVTAEQLKLRSGRVRCGACQQVFNALDSLIEEPIMAVAPRVAESTPAELGVARSETEVAVSPVPCVPAETFEIELETELHVPQPVAAEPVAPETAVPEPAAATEPDTAPEGEAPETDTADPAWSETFPQPPPPPRRWPWLIASLVALTALGVQVLLAFRVELAILWPEAKPALVALCDVADCEVGLPAKVGLIGIEASDLRPDNEHKGRLALTAALKNRAPFAQQFPHLELTLTDTADKAIARKVLAAADYLPRRISVTQGMQPNADIAIAVGIDSGEMAASGYRLYLFYP